MAQGARLRPLQPRTTKHKHNAGAAAEATHRRQAVIEACEPCRGKQQKASHEEQVERKHAVDQGH